MDFNFFVTYVVAFIFGYYFDKICAWIEKKIFYHKVVKSKKKWNDFTESYYTDDDFKEGK